MIGRDACAQAVPTASMECTYEMEPMQKYWVVRFSSELLKMVNNLSGSLLILSIGLLNLWLMGKFPKCIFDGITAMLIVCIQAPVLWSLSESTDLT